LPEKWQFRPEGSQLGGRVLVWEYLSQKRKRPFRCRKSPNLEGGGGEDVIERQNSGGRDFLPPEGFGTSAGRVSFIVQPQEEKKPCKWYEKQINLSEVSKRRKKTKMTIVEKKRGGDIKGGPNAWEKRLSVSAF